MSYRLKMKNETEKRKSHGGDIYSWRLKKKKCKQRIQHRKI